MAENDINNFKNTLSFIISEELLPENWSDNPLEVTYGTVKELISIIEESSCFSSSDIILPLSLISGFSVEKVRKLVGQPPNFIKKTKNFIKRNPNTFQSIKLCSFSNEDSVSENFIGENTVQRLGSTKF